MVASCNPSSSVDSDVGLAETVSKLDIPRVLGIWSETVKQCTYFGRIKEK
jgi:hypothetical protein